MCLNEQGIERYVGCYSLGILQNTWWCITDEPDRLDHIQVIHTLSDIRGRLSGICNNNTCYGLYNYVKVI